MSYKDGWDALNLIMPDRVPHCEFSLDMHYGLIKKLLGIELKPGDAWDLRHKASVGLAKALNYDFIWNVHTSHQIFGEKKTSMGHANYQEAGTDYDDNVYRLYENAEDIFKFDPYEIYGVRDKKKLTEDYNAHYANSCKNFDDAVNMTGVYVTCMSGLIALFGWESLLEACGMDSAGFGEVTDRYAAWIQQYFDALALCDSPVVMVHDDIVWTSGAFIHPEWYRRFVFPNYKKYFKPLHEAGKIIVYTSDGDYTEFIDDIAACGVNGFVLEPLTDMGYVAEKYGKTHMFMGNADTRVLLGANKDEIYSEVRRCMDIGKKYPGFFLAVGNHIPPNTPLDGVLHYLDAYEKMGKR